MINMTIVDVNVLLCCIFVSLTWGATVTIEDTRSDQPQADHRSWVPCDGPKVGHAQDEGKPEPPTRPISYGVVCDAGSSGTKLKIYRINRTVEGTQLPSIDLIYNKKFVPSLDTFVNDKHGLRDYLSEILAAALEILPEEYLAETHGYLLATAGLRFLDADASNQLIQDIADVFDSYHLNHFHGHEGIGILSGEEEGVYAWIALNYLLGTFANDRADNETVGVMEMGGGSTQIAFIPDNPILEGEFQVSVFGLYYDLYAHSYLQFGTNAINEWVATVLSEPYPGSLSIGNPCMLKGDTKEVQLNDGVKLQLHGTSDPESCKHILVQILHPETGIRCEPKPCAIGNVYQTSVGDSKFYATQGFTYAPIAFNVLGSDDVLNLDLLEQEAFKHCQRSLSEAREAGMDENVASSNCLMGLYTPTLFTLSYGFPKNTTSIKATSRIGINTIEWSLGIMVMDISINHITRRGRSTTRETLAD